MSLYNSIYHFLRTTSSLILISIVGAATCAVLADDPPRPDEAVETAAAPNPPDSDDLLSRQGVGLLVAKCTNCHGAEMAEGSLRLDSREALLRGGDRGSALTLLQPQHSLLWQSVAGLSDELEMPPKNPLTAKELALIERWLMAGANWPKPDRTSPAMSPSEGPANAPSVIGDAWSDQRNPIVQIFGGQRLDLWSLKPIQTPVVPETIGSTWARGDLDRFVQARFESAGVSLPMTADRHTLVRRIYYDLTGLPPNPDEAAAFESATRSVLADTEQLVDRLLNTEQFGQHWARMWLDVVRYSDSNGFDWDEFRPQAWRFRDFVIRSLNSDKPFNQFVCEQLAGDELFEGPPQNDAQRDALIATGFLRLGPHDNAAKLFNEQDRSRDELLTDLVETTGSAFLGMTLSCCRCHDHKYDPISQADHFRLRACFAGVKFADDLPIDMVEDQNRIEQHNAQIDQQINQSEAEQDLILEAVGQRLEARVDGDSESQPPTVSLDSSKLDSNKLDSSNEDTKAAKKKKKLKREQLLKAASEAERQSVQALEESVKQLKAKKLTYTHAMLMVETTDKIPETYVLFQGDHKSPREKVEPGVLSALNPNTLQSAQAIRQGSSGRRLALAQWITSPDNPLTARVFVNRVWQNLMGRGLVSTAGDFGLAGASPDEPELLDWLSRRFMEEGWSIQWLVRTIMLSSTYQQAASYTEPDSRISHLVRFPRRLTAEQLRDSILVISGLLTSKAAGPPAWPDLPKDVLEANPAFLDDNETKTKGWYPSAADQQHCRSIFLVQKRNTRVPILETFDLPENSVPCTRRLTSIVAPQALSLLNGTEAVKSARRFAERVADMETSDADRLEYAFLAAYQRPPTENEAQTCKEFLKRTSWTELCRVLLNTNEFAYLD